MERDRVVRSPRLAARRRAVRVARRRHRRRAVASLLVMGGLAYGGVAMMRSQLFALAEIQVAGARSVPERRVVEASGLRMGENTLGIDLDAIAARVRNAFPQVRDARAVRAGSLGIRIEVVERAGVIELRHGKTRVLLDEDAFPAPARASEHVPVVELEVGVAPSDGRAAVTSVLRIREAMPSAMRSRVERFSYRAHGDIAFRYGGAQVVFGRAERIAEKLDALALLRRRVRANRLRLVAVDLRAPGHPAARVA